MFSKKNAPEKYTDEYAASKKATDSDFKIGYELLQRPLLELERQKAQLQDVEDRLAKFREHYKTQRENLDNQWEALAKKEQLFGESFIKFNKFVRENLEKRTRAMEKIGDDKKIHREKNAEVKALRQKYEEMVENKARMDEMLKSHSIYEEFLHKVVNVANDFKTVDDIIGRYEVYMEAKGELAARQEANLKALESARTKMVKFMEGSSLILVGLYNKLAKLTGRYENATMKSRQLETIVSQIGNNALTVLREAEMVKDSIWNIYILMCHRKRIVPRCLPSDVENQLAFIKKTLRELKEVNRLLQRRISRQRSNST